IHTRCHPGTSLERPVLQLPVSASPSLISSTPQMRHVCAEPHNLHSFEFLEDPASLRALLRIQITMKAQALIPLVLVVLAGCTAHDRSPDEIREQTARATSTAARDAKAVAQGVVEGVKQQRTININRSSAD